MTDSFQILWRKLQDSQLQPSEFDELMNSIQESGDEDELIFQIQSDIQSHQLRYPMDTEKKLAILNAITSSKSGNKIMHRVHFLRTAWFRYAAAIAIITGIGTYLWNTQQKEKPQIVENKSVSIINDVPPGSNKATLTLSSGRQIILDAAAGKTIADGELTIKNQNGALVYVGADRMVMNTMTTPKGGQYQLTLADGTKVWLNAASSITYPTTFKDAKREVVIAGEAYFEVAKNKEKPFLVRTDRQEIQVLGTSFNVNAYVDEPVSKTSLVDGSVRINGQILKPGQGYSEGKIIQTNVDQDIAWKNGYFNFQRATLEQLMRQLSRWYDIEVVYDNGIPIDKLMGKMDRNLSLQDALLGLEGVAGHFKLVGKTVYVSSLK